MKFLNKLKELPFNSRICLYGAGEGARHFKRRLERDRKDAKVICCIDDFKRGEKDGMKIIAFDDVQIQKNNFDLILITSTYWRDMYKNLEDVHIYNFMTVNPFLMFENQIFTEEEEWIYRRYFKKVQRILAYEEDKILYRHIIESRSIKQDRCGLYEYFKYNSFLKKKEYLEFINQAHINTIIEGGVLEGDNTIEFLRSLPKDGAIYGFEPFYRAYLEGKNRIFLGKFPNLKVFPMALRKDRDKIRFLENEDNKPASRVIANSTVEQKATYIDDISIDEFAREHDIKRSIL